MVERIVFIATLAVACSSEPSELRAVLKAHCDQLEDYLRMASQDEVTGEGNAFFGDLTSREVHLHLSRAIDLCVEIRAVDRKRREQLRRDVAKAVYHVAIQHDGATRASAVTALAESLRAINVLPIRN